MVGIHPLLLAIALLAPIISSKGGCSRSSPCYEGGGDCDNDYHCQGRLLCGRNNCDDNYGTGWDCCYSPSKELSETCTTIFTANTGGYGICAAVSTVFCPATLGIGCAVAGACGASSAISTIGEALICRKRRDVGKENQEERLMESKNYNAILQELEFRDYRESLEDWALASTDLKSLVRGTSVEQAVTKILMVDEAYKRLKKTPKFRLLKENDPEVDNFGQAAMESWIPQRVLSKFLSGNSTLYGGPPKRCGMETVNALEAVLIKGSVYLFMGQQIVDKKNPSQDQIDDLKALLLANRAAFNEHCSLEDVVINTKDPTSGLLKSFNGAEKGNKKENRRLK